MMLPVGVFLVSQHGHRVNFLCPVECSFLLFKENAEHCNHLHQYPDSRIRFENCSSISFQDFQLPNFHQCYQPCDVWYCFGSGCTR